MKRVLFLLSHTERGGGETVAYNLVKHIDRTRFQPCVGHVDFRQGAFINEFRRLGVSVTDFHAGHLRDPISRGWTIRRLSRFLQSEGVETIVTTSAHSQIYAALARNRHPASIISYVMNHYEPRLSMHSLILRAAFWLGADYYLAPSKSCLASLNPFFSPFTPRGVLYHGVDPEAVSAGLGQDRVRTTLGMKPGQKLVSIIGRLQRWKGHEIFLEAASEVARAVPEARFAIVGGTLFGLEEGYPTLLKKLIHRNGLENRCWLVGHQTNPYDWMAASDAVVHASRTPEPGANSVLEAMAVGRPVVASDCGAPAEIIEDGFSGLLFPPGESHPLAGRIIRVLKDLDLSAQLSRNARQVIQERFTAKRMASLFGNVLNRLGQKPVLFTFSSSRRGGHEASTLNIIKAVSRDRFLPMAAFLCRDTAGPLPEDLKRAEVEVFLYHTGRMRNPWDVFRAVRWLISLMRTRRVSLAFTSGGQNQFYARLAAWITRRPTVSHETYLFEKPFWRNGPIYTLDFLLGADAYVSDGRLTSETIRAADPWRRPVVHLPPMVDLSVFDSRMSQEMARKQWRLPTRAFVFMLPGRIQEWKGQDIFVQAALRLAPKEPLAYFLVVGGAWQEKDKPFEATLRFLVNNASLQERILFAGELPNPAAAFAAANVICHCSKRPEPFGQIVLESFAMKKPIIAVNQGGPAELIRPNVDGWLIPPADPGVLEDRMQCCIHAPQTVLQMGEAGFQRFRVEHGDAAFRQRVNRLLDRYAKCP